MWFDCPEMGAAIEARIETGEYGSAAVRGFLLVSLKNQTIGSELLHAAIRQLK